MDEKGLKDKDNETIDKEALDKNESDGRETEAEIVMERCYYCGKELPIDELYDDGNDLSCEECL